jgi:hypothetical protein
LAASLIGGFVLPLSLLPNAPIAIDAREQPAFNSPSEPTREPSGVATESELEAAAEGGAESDAPPQPKLSFAARFTAAFSSYGRDEEGTAASPLSGDEERTASAPVPGDDEPAEERGVSRERPTLHSRRNSVRIPASPRDAGSLAEVGAGTAIYDIAAHVVYLPNGEKLEAHSGLGHSMDDPRHVDRKNRGPTPPNVYNLVLRKEPFHGVRAIRLVPVDERKMFGRDGILAHSYLLGPSGQSHGCVSFRDYSRFQRAFERGEFNRMIVVPKLAKPPTFASRERATG